LPLLLLVPVRQTCWQLGAGYRVVVVRTSLERATTDSKIYYGCRVSSIQGKSFVENKQIFSGQETVHYQLVFGPSAIGLATWYKMW
jgi:hypothetical protein